MRNRPIQTHGRALAAGLCVLMFSAGLQIQAASAQDANGATPKAHASAAPSATANKPARKGMYYVDFRARTAASYGHAFVWYGRADQRKVEVAGLHPATDNVIPYILGHVIPVPSETGASYGDLDEQYLTASYRVYMDEAQANRVFAYIKQLQASSPVWNAAVYNCVAFIQDIARNMGLRVPNNHLLYPEDWVNSLRALNGGGRSGRSSAMQAAPQRASSATPAAAPAAALSPAQVMEAYARPH